MSSKIEKEMKVQSLEKETSDSENLEESPDMSGTNRLIVHHETLRVTRKSRISQQNYEHL